MKFIEKKDCLKIDTSYDYDKMIEKQRRHWAKTSAKSYLMCVDREQIQRAKMLCYELQEHAKAYIEYLLSDSFEMTIKNVDIFRERVKSGRNTLVNTQTIYESVCRMKFLRSEPDCNYLNCHSDKAYNDLCYNNFRPYNISRYERFVAFEL